ncbi:hypothetical protein DFP72DRAFT_830525 [Ephemerocybe angulata]|uniref:Uncharacterized protein n=1 Tax=Ephemerocybe angulata TaxID=980116 RepID=A0A8H6HAU2_9AGAR|nr:hypothetical protein DFP72DRAFT_830525 [Tulosesus angulatus]
MDAFYPNTQAPSLAGSAAVPGAILQSSHTDDLLYDNPVVSGGFLYKLHGETYYSPNCRRLNLELPPKVESSHDGVINGRDFEIVHFRKPQWWTTAHGYLAFLPLRPDLSSPPLHPLLRIPKVLFDPRTGQFYPGPAVWEGWKELQAKIAHAIHVLIYRSGAPAVRPAYPCSRVDRKMYKGPGGKHNLKEDMFDALSWFSVWFACLAYAIAVSEAVDRATRKAGYRTVPAWMEILASEYISKELDGRFVSSLPNSCLASFDGTFERVGSFVNIPDDDMPVQHGMVSIDWLCELNVPVWYRWGPREIAIAEKNPFWNRYAPPKDAEVVACPSPGPTEATVSPITSEPPVPPHPPKELFKPFRRRTEPVDKPWEAWFKEREQRNALIIPKQSQAARSRRLNWEHNPPTNPKKTKFFVWDKNEDGVFRRRKAGEDDLEDLFQPEGAFSRSQARYDAVSNEWDLCEFFGPADDARLKHLAELDAEYRDNIPTPETTQPVRQRTLEDDPMDIETGPIEDTQAFPVVPSPQITEPDGNAMDILPEEPSFVANRFFGYVEPLAPLPIPVPALKASFVPKVLGLGKSYSTGDALWSTATGQQLLSFLHALVKGKPASDLWDLSRYNRTPVTSLPRFKQLRTSLAQCLTFARVDYDYYLRQLSSILSARPGVGRAAVMRGGIVGRICMSHVSTDDILCGPSQAALEGRGIVRSNGNGGFLVDDNLQVQEVDAICGHIDLWNSQDNQITRVSWWPPADLWEERYGFTGWSPDAEDFYHARLSEINRTWKPLPRSEWRKRLRQSSAFRSLLASVEKHARDVIEHSSEGGL